MLKVYRFGDILAYVMYQVYIRNLCATPAT